ncbi:MAG: hypothetical protein ABIH50_03820 [bacterium]
MKNKFLALTFLALLAATCAFAMGPAPHLPGILELQTKINADLNRLDNDTKQTAEKLGSLDLTGPDANALLKGLYNDNNFVVNAVIVDLKGNIIAVGQDRYQGSIGENLSGQDHIIKLFKTGKPVLSSLFKTVEGFYAISLAYPISSAGGKTAGYLSVVFRPDTMMGNIINPYLANTPGVEVLAIQEDGLIIYDKDIMQIGKLTFSDPLYQNYPQLLKMAKQVTLQDSGTGTYEFPAGFGQLPVAKTTEWTTISLHGTEWRLIVSKTEK